MNIIKYAIFALLLFSCGCVGDSLAFMTGTTLGIRMTGVEGEQQKLKVGYDRTEVAYVPMKKTETYQQTDADSQSVTKKKKEAYSVYSGFYFHNKWWFPGSEHGVRLVQVFGTGRAAKKLAENKGKGVVNTLSQIKGFELKADSEEKPEFNRLKTRALRLYPSSDADNVERLEINYMEKVKQVWPSSAAEISTPADAKRFVQRITDESEAGNIQDLINAVLGS